MKRYLFALVLLVSSNAWADDWPQWMGPQRDNIWREDGILEKFPEGGPKVIWRTELAGGYAGPAVAAGKVFITDYVTADNVKIANFERKESTGIERVFCLDEATGKEIWKHEYPVTYTISYPAGPRCTPSVHDGKVYTLGAEGHLFCFDVNTGKIVWQKDLTKEYKTKAALWGYAAHPLVDGNKLICVVGGEGTHTVAFDLNTGQEIWHNQDSPEQGYSPPTIIEAGGVRQLISCRPNGVSSSDPETGKENWSVPYSATSGSIIMSPVKSGDYLYVGGYSDQSLMLKLAADKPAADIEWGNERKQGISPVNVQPIVDGDTIYGFDQSGTLMAVAVPSGDRLWETSAPVSEKPEGSGTAFIVRQGDRYWLFNESGDLIIAKLSPEKYEELDRVNIIKPTNNAFGRDVVWCMPAFANKKLFVRNDAEIICVDLAAQ
ncbi:MAG: PQQ-binding-like beta-propeller repeat protein [Bythopirellula sp.]|nr:PQQ-binding-like beta-propeller repeat protein [Bythopirellula sp.]